MGAIEESIKFYSASGAYKWAVEAAERPGVISSTQVVIRSMKEQMGSTALTRDDIEETALSVLAVVKRIEPPVARMAFKAALGPPEETLDAELTSQLARTVWTDEQRRPYSTCSRLARITLLRSRAEEQHAQAIPRAWYAHALKIRRQSLGTWDPVINELEALMDDWVAQGKMKAKQLLDQAGLIHARDED